MRLPKRLSVTPPSVRAWIGSYKGNGIDAFTHTKNKHYSHECKAQAVTAYLNQEGSLTVICQRFGLRSSTQLRTWIKRYNSHEELKASGTGGFSIMTKGRKTTFDERVEIVQYCIAHDHNYAETAVTYDVSYQQARSYTLKYEAGGLRMPYRIIAEKRKKRRQTYRSRKITMPSSKLERAKRKQDGNGDFFLKKIGRIERRRTEPAEKTSYLSGYSGRT